uniref:Cyclin C-terminal domain-containing protein n=1 Tax=Ascaris lumbricoides TaxID=6252 RepID=A0A0M3IAB0_ASCLU
MGSINFRCIQINTALGLTATPLTHNYGLFCKRVIAAQHHFSSEVTTLAASLYVASTDEGRVQRSILAWMC